MTVSSRLCRTIPKASTVSPTPRGSCLLHSKYNMSTSRNLSTTSTTSNYTKSAPKRSQSWRRNLNDSTRSLAFYPVPSRSFSTTPKPCHGHLEKPKPGEERHVTFISKTAQPLTVTVADGANLLDIAQAHDIDVEGACGGSCACSTCHLIVEASNGLTASEMYDKIPEPSDDENDMLDLAFGLTETSRLGCQVEMSKELDGLVVKLPSMTRNLQKSDFASSGES
jgi:ferredoxin